tara:strand:+ start:276 stop:845 length:570 start_codon:yes stop_codon:yes gene_type:complete
MNPLETVTESPLNISLLQLIIPEIKDAIRKVAPYGKGYKLPFYGKMKAKKDYENLLDAVDDERLQLKIGDTDVFDFREHFAAGKYEQKKWHEGIKYDDIIGNVKEAYTGKNVIKVRPIEWFEDRYGKKEGKAKQMQTIFHELLHGIGQHYGEGRNVRSERLLSSLLFPESTGSYNRQAKNLYEKYLEGN